MITVEKDTKVTQRGVIVFDFDDTLTVDTEKQKKSLFVELFEELPEGRLIAQEFVHAHPGMPRKEMITGIVHALVERQLIEHPEKHIESYLNAFTKLAEDKAVNAVLRPHAEQVLRHVHMQYTLYLLSANPQSAIEQIAQRRGWAHLFAGIYGTTTSSKIEYLSSIIAREGVQPTQVVMIGDGINDMTAASACGCLFIGIHGSNSSFDELVTFPVLHELQFLPDTIAQELSRAAARSV